MLICYKRHCYFEQLAASPQYLYCLKYTQNTLFYSIVLKISINYISTTPHRFLPQSLQLLRRASYQNIKQTIINKNQRDRSVLNISCLDNKSQNLRRQQQFLELRNLREYGFLLARQNKQYFYRQIAQEYKPMAFIIRISKYKMDLGKRTWRSK